MAFENQFLFYYLKNNKKLIKPKEKIKRKKMNGFLMNHLFLNLRLPFPLFYIGKRKIQEMIGKPFDSFSQPVNKRKKKKTFVNDLCFFLLY